jgi:hypothetical protein
VRNMTIGGQITFVICTVILFVFGSYLVDKYVTVETAQSIFGSIAKMFAKAVS